MEKFEIVKDVGDGTFGNVWQAINKHSGEVVAIKKLKKKYYSWEECLNLREVKSLRKMNHPNIVKLKEIIRENDTLFFIFEFMECDLYQLMKHREKQFSETKIRHWCFQIFQALAYIHRRGYFHRDLKPENLLCMKDVIKIADFGLAREISSLPPFTEYVSTRWYRAPEILLQASVYDSAVDMWAMGAIMSEMFTLRPLFPGSSEADEIYKICSVIGTPNRISWSEGLHLADDLNFQFPQCSSVHLSRVIPSASDAAISLISSLCTWDPSKRLTAAEALQHPFFQSCFYIPPSLRPRVAGMPKASSVGTRGNLEPMGGRKYPVGAFPNAKPANNLASSYVNAPIKTGVERKFEMNYQESAGRNEHHMQYGVKQGPYRPSARNYPAPENVGRNSSRVWDATNKTGANQEPLPFAKATHSTRGSYNGDKLVHSTRMNDVVSNVSDKLSLLTVRSGPQQHSGHPQPLPFATAGGMRGRRAAAA